jgi:hypothetical protein
MPGKIVYLTAAAPNNGAAFFMLFNTKKKPGEAAGLS